MLAELAIANAAFQVIKQTLANGKELADAGKSVSDYFAAEKKIAKQAEAKTGDVLEAFQAKRQLEKQEEELKAMLNQQSLLGYEKFLQFKAQYSRDLREAEKLEARKKYKRQQAIEENIALGLKAMAILFIIMGVAFGVAIYYKGH
jgi:Ser/Thr protein kinase RdoA (MazF antagonist)